MAEQFGLVTTNPPDFLRQLWHSMQLDVVVIDFRDDQRHILLHAQSAGVGDHSAASVGETRLQLGGDAGIERGEDHFGRAVGRGRRDSHSATLAGIAVFSRQRAASAYGLAFGAVRSGQPRHFEPGMVLQHLDKALPDDAGSAENSDRDFRSS